MVEGRVHLQSLQAGRAIAALMVVVFHIQVFYLPERLYPGQDNFLHPVTNMGYAGVEFFFALSGFLMAYIHQKDMGRRDRLGAYMAKRVSRIYPAYWLVLVPLILLGMVVPSLKPEEPTGVLSMIGNFLLLPLPHAAILEVSWTLQFEMVFYCLFALTILSRTFGRIILGLWFLACAVMAFFPPLAFPLSFFLSPYNLIFLFGGAAAVAFRHVRGGAAWPVLAAGLALFFGTGVNDVYGYFEIGLALRTVLYGIGASLIITGLASLEWQSRLKVPKSLTLLGDASYMLYLVHIPALAAGAIILRALNMPQLMPPWLLAIVMAIGCSVLSVILHLCLEKPIVRWVSARIVPARRPAPADQLSGSTS